MPPSTLTHQPSPQRLGIMGGTFDPPHLGHLILAEAAREALELDAVWFLPAAQPPHKQGRAVSAPIHRLTMVRLAIASNPHFALSTLDVERPGPHYSVDAMRLLRARLGAGTELFFLVGEDSLVDLPTWREPEALLALACLAVVERPGIESDVGALEAQLPALRGRVRLVDAPLVELASTAIRARVRAGRSIRHLVPDGVARYIAEQALYRG